MGLAEMLARAAEDHEAAPKILPEAALMRLREAAARYAEHLRGPRFNAGDVVTPAAGGDVMGVGDPHVVVETRPGAECTFERGEMCTSQYGCRWDMRVLSIGGGSNIISAYWVESWTFETWTGDARA